MILAKSFLRSTQSSRFEFYLSSQAFSIDRFDRVYIIRTSANVLLNVTVGKIRQMLRFRFPVMMTLLIGFMASTYVHAGVIQNGAFETSLANWEVRGSVGVDQGGFGITPPEGSGQAYLQTGPGVKPAEMESLLGIASGTLGTGQHQGATIWQTVSLDVDDYVAFDWNFLTTEDPSKNNFGNDFAFWTLSGETAASSAVWILAKVADSGMSSSGSSLGRETGYRPAMSFTIQTAGIYTLGFGILNVGNNSKVSTLLIDNVRVMKLGTDTSAGGDDDLISSSNVVPEPGTLAIFGLGTLGLVAGGLRRRRIGSPRTV